MSDRTKTTPEEEKLNNFIEQKRIENEVLKKLLDELSKERDSYLNKKSAIK